MISSIKFPTLKHLKKSWVTIGIIATLASLMIFGCIKVGLIVMGSYFLFALVENIRFFSKKRIF